MPGDELDRERAAGVVFWGYESRPSRRRHGTTGRARGDPHPPCLCRPSEATRWRGRQAP
jgi:hypothetical protein